MHFSGSTKKIFCMTKVTVAIAKAFAESDFDRLVANAEETDKLTK